MTPGRLDSGRRHTYGRAEPPLRLPLSSRRAARCASLRPAGDSASAPAGSRPGGVRRPLSRGEHRRVTGGSSMTTATRSIEEVALDSIRDHPQNLRREIGDVSELAESMKTFGVLEPIVLAPALDADGGVVLIAGHRRRAAARKAGLSAIPAQVRHDLDSEAKQMLAMLVENGRRRDLSPIEEARGYQQVLDLGEFTAAKIGKAIGVSTARVKGRVALTCPPGEVQDKIHWAHITVTEA